MNNKIQISYGATVNKSIIVEGTEFDENDMAFIVIRDKKDAVVWWGFLPFVETHNGAYKVTIKISAAENENIFKPGGEYKWGLTWYRNPEFTDPDTIPVGGIVRVVVRDAQFLVAEHVARKEGVEDARDDS